MNNISSYIVLINYNSWQETIDCIRSLYTMGSLDITIVIVDNASQDKSLHEIVNALQDDLHLIRRLRVLDHNFTLKGATTGSGIQEIVLITSTTNSGFAGGNNLALSFITQTILDSNPYIWFLNNDTIVDKEAFNELREIHERFNHKVIVGSKLLFYDNPSVIQSIGGKYNKLTGVPKLLGLWCDDSESAKHSIQECDYVMAASMFVDLNFFRVVGLFDEAYFLYFEELDLVSRAKKKGYKVVTALNSRVYHKVGKSIGSNPRGKYRSKLSDYYLLRNRLLYSKRFYPIYLPSVFCGVLVSIGLRLARKQLSHAMNGLRIVFYFIIGKLPNKYCEL